jgi:phage FluMu protein Com
MMHYTKRCKHCNTVYSWQASGEGCFHELNDEKYCPDCKRVINEALKLVPKKFKKIWVETNEVTYDYLKAERAKQDEKNGGLCMRRVYVSLFNIKNGTREINDAFDVDDKQYCVLYWSDTPDIIKIQVLKEVDIETNEIIRYWKDYNS